MATFQKPESLKAALKLALYGPAGSGKTFSSLLLSEGLAQHTNKRVAFIDTEHGTAFYGQTVPQRHVHPQAFDFDVLHTKSITEALDAVRGLDLNTYGVLVIDSISHLWDACRNAFRGKLTKAGTIPLHAWANIKRPYRDLMHEILTMPVHVLICGRQGNDFAEDEGGELKNLGFKMRAEGETAYEPDVLVRLEAHKPTKNAQAIPLAHVEKDRTGVLAGQTIAWPTFEALAKPLLGLLGTKQVALPTEDEVGIQDADALATKEAELRQKSAELAKQYTGRLAAADSVAELQRIGGELTPAVKQRFVEQDLVRVRSVYVNRMAKLRASENGTAQTA